MDQLREELLKELPEFERKTQLFYQKEISIKDYKGYSGGFGSYAQRGGSTFMLRLRMNQGRITKEKLKFLVEQCEKYDIERTHCTTCQTVQLHDVKPEALTPIMKEALEKGIITRGGGGDFPRNVMCSPLSGIDPEEPFDVYPYAKQAGEYLLSIINKYSLPRKLKVAFSNSKANETHANFRDLGFIANEDHTFDVYCCGGLGNNPRMGVKVGDHINPKDILYYVNTMVLLFMEHGNYTNRAKARTRYLQETLGIDGIQKQFKEKVERAMKNLDHDVSPVSNPVSKTGPLWNDLPKRVIAQKQKGLYAVYYHPLCGNMTTAKWKELWDVIENMEDVEIRLSPQEDLYIVNLTEKEAREVLSHTDDGARTQFEASVSCIGAATCQIGLRDSNNVLKALIEALRPYNFEEGVLPKIYISGCPSSCGANQIGAIGLQGFTKLVDKKPYPAFKMTVQGQASMDATQFGKEVGLILQDDINAFFIELGQKVTQAHQTFDLWQKENADQWQALLEKYL